MIKIEEGKHFKVTQWSPTVPNYECLQSDEQGLVCQYATIDKAAMQRHWDKSERHKHIWKGPAQEV